MNKFNKIVIIGPKSVHIENYLAIIQSLFCEIIFISEKEANYNLLTKSYIVNFRYSNPFKIKKSFSKLKKIILDENPDFVHVHSINRQAFYTSFITKKHKIPLIATAWGSDVLIVPKRNVFFKKMVTQVLNKANYITADSNDLIEEINRLSPQKKVKLVFYGIDPILEKTKENIIYSNRLHNPLYNIDKIIEYFYVFQKSYSNWKLVIGATGSDTEKLKQQVADLKLNNKVEFVGWLDKEKNNHYYQISSIYISIPKSDGTSISLLEAMSAGCIPVVNNIPVSHEWIKEGINGIITKKGDENILEKAISLNREEVAKINSDIITKKATKVIANKNFSQIFTSINTNTNSQLKLL